MPPKKLLVIQKYNFNNFFFILRRRWRANFSINIYDNLNLYSYLSNLIR